MAIIVEANLRVPSLSVTDDKGSKTINNQALRFRKMIEVAAIPKVDEMLELSTSDGIPLPCRVTRSDWEEDRQLFVVSCKYSPSRITSQTFEALLTDAEWKKTELTT